MPRPIIGSETDKSFGRASEKHTRVLYVAAVPSNRSNISYVRCDVQEIATALIERSDAEELKLTEMMRC
jgi:hypothetical protein